MSDIQKLITLVNEFRDERNWRQYHNPKDLAISISIEAAELLEDFQWINSEEALKENKENIREEIADVLIYSLMLCSDLDLDVIEIVEEKMVKNGKKYPVG
ncbi:nucleotide pyrophosphohydrolase [Guptibacillus hwajinpoensis]|uniref:Nucleotide pyrophosphohydrolase n=1 Tax=Guptibacillus hwajinpoensis TaxID=208199 RepID=A0A0J6CYU9_9BACL|nr:nucleotide pyrophosphohydrolase [Alkalihalobacillus macyae]KMM37209.1 nucleotide pyrophosphohydrolase [Alkalihalobacillus macyae]